MPRPMMESSEVEHHVAAPPNSTRRKIRHPSRCSHTSEGLVRRLPQCSTSKAFTGTLATGAR
jgi:hypothetical protein